MAKVGRAKAKKERGVLSGQLARLLDESEDSLYALEESAKIPHGCLSRFMTQERGLTLETLDRLAKVMGLRLAQVEKRVGNRRRRMAVAPA